MIGAKQERAARLAEERGSVVALFGLMVPVLLLFFMLVIDVGNWFVHKQHLQMQADAAVLAGGAEFGDCFSPDPATAAAANDTIKAAATAYAGNAASTYNFQVGGGAPSVTTLFNSKTFFIPGPGPDDTETDEPCDTPSLMLDVKQTEADVPYILGALLDFVVPGSTTVVPAINARARVQLKKATIVQGSLPLAVPDVDPKYVTATFVDESAGGALLAGPIALTKGAAAGGLNYWEGTGSVTVPADVKVGVRIGLGGLSGTCAADNGTGGTGYVCYDYSDAKIGLVAIRGVGSGGTVAAPKPRVWATTTCASTGGPFFSPEDVASPATTCPASVQVVMESAEAIDPGQVLLFNAIADGGGLKKVSAPLIYDAASGYWTTGYVYNVPVDGGAVDVSLEWRYEGGTKQTYSNVQRIYSASEETSGPVKALSLSSPTGTLGSPYALSAGTHTVTVTVGIEGSLDLSSTDETVMLRLTGGSRTSAVACDGTGAAEFKESIINGCETPYQINPVGYCPDPDPPPGPADCVPTKTGTTAGPTLQGLDERFAACPDNNWPDYDVKTDPRVVKLMITDFSALGGSGTTEVPVTNFAAFYITGWTGSKCSNNEPAPLEVKKGAIWGHFVKHVAPDPNSGGTEACDPLAITPCIPVLVK
ncbi:MAG TPA: Tad domain-containing protein [Gaiellaceae bacterium]|nr:Tad domain-containing protein [Gaiellaceae bacterium]